MSWNKRVSMEHRQVYDIGTRMYDLIEMMGFKTLQEFCDKCMVPPASIRRLKKDPSYVPSFEMLARIVVVFPKINVNWLISGKGPPLVDFESLHYGLSIDKLKQKAKAVAQSIEEHAGEFQKHVNEMLTELQDTPNQWSEEKRQELLKMRGEVPHNLNRYKNLGRIQRTVIEGMERGERIEFSGGYYYLIKGKSSSQLPDRIVQSLVMRQLIIEYEPNKWRYNGKLL